MPGTSDQYSTFASSAHASEFQKKCSTSSGGTSVAATGSSDASASAASASQWSGKASARMSWSKRRTSRSECWQRYAGVTHSPNGASSVGAALVPAPSARPRGTLTVSRRRTVCSRALSTFFEGSRGSSSVSRASRDWRGAGARAEEPPAPPAPPAAADGSALALRRSDSGAGAGARPLLRRAPAAPPLGTAPCGAGSGAGSGASGDHGPRHAAGGWITAMPYV